jgi:hypothetical protein
MAGARARQELHRPRAARNPERGDRVMAAVLQAEYHIMSADIALRPDRSRRRP